MLLLEKIEQFHYYTSMKTSCFLLLCIFGCISLVGSQEPVPLLSGEWPPYTSSELEANGFFSRIVREAFRAEGLDIEIQFYPWVRNEKILEAAGAFAAFPYSITQKRLERFDFSREITVSANPPRIFYYRPHGIPDNYTDLKSLKGYTVISYRGYYIADVLQTEGIPFLLAGDEEQALRMLYGNRGDLFPNDPESGWNLIRQVFPKEAENFAVLENSFPGASMHLMVSKNYPGAEEILGIFERGLEKIVNNGVYHSILKQYNKEAYSIVDLQGERLRTK